MKPHFESFKQFMIMMRNIGIISEEHWDEHLAWRDVEAVMKRLTGRGRIWIMKDTKEAE